ncbi:hypothetical protein L7F22_038561 [Adiantum nelumboides]|nr:hypothetical protein [Adiantum nelumboides]
MDVEKVGHALELNVQDAPDWCYRGEGAANIVLAYRGSDPFLVGKVLRLRKIPLDGQHAQEKDTWKPILAEDEQKLWASWPSVSRATTLESLIQAYARDVMSPLLNSEYIDPGILVQVSNEFLEEVSCNVHHARPWARISAAKIDTKSSSALLISDHSVFWPRAGSFFCHFIIFGFSFICLCAYKYIAYTSDNIYALVEIAVLIRLVHVVGKKNVVANALSRRPHVAAVSISYQHELDEMRDHYSTDRDFAKPFDALVVASILIRHKGIDSTIKALEMYFFWPSLREDTESFVRSCLVCQRVNYDRGKAYGLLQPLPIPKAPWESIAMDFIFGLPKKSFRNEGIRTIVDRFSKQAHFVPVWKQITVEQIAKSFLVIVFKYHGMPRSIVSDRDPRMTGLFWRALWQNLHSTLRFPSSYHPHTDGQYEIVNSAVLDLLNCLVSDNLAQWEHY